MTLYKTPNAAYKTGVIPLVLIQEHEPQLWQVTGWLIVTRSSDVET